MASGAETGPSEGIEGSLGRMEKEGRGKGSLKPERLTRQQARDAEQNADAGDEGGATAAAEEGTPTVSSIFLAMRTTRNRSRTP
jgi:hypothetical protein